MNITQFTNTLDTLEYSKGWYDLMESAYDLALSEKALEIIEFREMNYLTESTYFVEKEKAEKVVNDNKKSFGSKIKSVLRWIWDHTIGALIKLFNKALADAIDADITIHEIAVINKNPQIVNACNSELDKRVYAPLRELFELGSINTAIDKGKFICGNTVKLTKKGNAIAAINPKVLIKMLEDISKGFKNASKNTKKINDLQNNRTFTVSFLNGRETLNKLKQLQKSSNVDNLKFEDKDSLDYLQSLKNSVNYTIRCMNAIVMARGNYHITVDKYYQMAK